MNELCLCEDLFKTCLFFPDMSIKDGDWKWDETGSYKIRRYPKVFKCMYDDKKIIWDRICPYWLDHCDNSEEKEVEQNATETV